MQAIRCAQRNSQQEAAALRPKRLLHSTKQTGKKAALLLRLFIEQRIHRAVNRNLSAFNGERMQMQGLSADHKHAL